MQYLLLGFIIFISHCFVGSQGRMNPKVCLGEQVCKIKRISSFLLWFHALWVTGHGACFTNIGMGREGRIIDLTRIKRINWVSNSQWRIGTEQNRWFFWRRFHSWICKFTKLLCRIIFCPVFFDFIIIKVLSPQRFTFDFRPTASLFTPVFPKAGPEM